MKRAVDWFFLTLHWIGVVLIGYLLFYETGGYLRASVLLTLGLVCIGAAGIYALSQQAERNQPPPTK